MRVTDAGGFRLVVIDRDADFEDPVVIGGLHVGFGGAGRERDDTGEHAVVELAVPPPVLGLALLLHRDARPSSATCHRPR